MVELVEVSLDYNLASNCVRFSFPDTPIAGGLSIHESHGYVIILVPTLGAAHRLVFPHPNRLQKYVRLFDPIHPVKIYKCLRLFNPHTRRDTL